MDGRGGSKGSIGKVKSNSSATASRSFQASKRGFVSSCSPTLERSHQKENCGSKKFADGEEKLIRGIQRAVICPHHLNQHWFLQRSARDSTICLLWQDSSVSCLIQVIRVQLQLCHKLLAMPSVNNTLYPPPPGPLEEIGAVTVFITPITLGKIHM